MNNVEQNCSRFCSAVQCVVQRARPLKGDRGPHAGEGIFYPALNAGDVTESFGRQEQVLGTVFWAALFIENEVFRPRRRLRVAPSDALT